MGRRKKIVVFHTRNKHGIRMARCCMSCAYREETELMTERVCALDKVKHRRYHMCRDWEMNRTMQAVGTSGGRIKRREYLMYVLSVRLKEQEAEDMQLPVEPKTIEEMRAAFEKEHGSIFVDF